MGHLNEKLALEGYRKEHPEVRAEASFIEWALGNGESDMLPVMKSGITLSRGNRVLTMGKLKHLTSPSLCLTTPRQ